jgi:HD-GYP domain
MKRVSIESVVSGQRLAKTVYSSDRKILLEMGIILSDIHINKLKLYDIEELSVEDCNPYDEDYKDNISMETRTESKKLIHKIMESDASNLDSEYAIIKSYVNNIIDQLLDKKDILVNLNHIREADDYTFEHSVSVCIYSLIIGISIGYSEEELLELGIGAILHDIGKLKIPDYILKKPSQLTDNEFYLIKNHTIYGYEILSSCENISKRSAEIALYHHERVDGSGYPHHMSVSEIPEFARIAAIADVFDALTSDRVYRGRLGPKDVIEYMTSSEINHFDCKMLDVFIKFVILYPVGSSVVLNSGEKGIVLAVNKNYPTKPIIRLVKDISGNKLPVFEVRDLSSDERLYVTGTCDL